MNPEGASSSLFFFPKQCHGVVESKYDVLSGLYLPLTGETFFVVSIFSQNKSAIKPVLTFTQDCCKPLMFYILPSWCCGLDVLLCTNLTKKY